jgi:hypothetical protein
VERLVVTTHCNEGFDLDPQARAALAYVRTALLDIIRNGFGELRVQCTVEKGQRRALTVTAGPTRRFVVPVEELPGAQVRRDP